MMHTKGSNLQSTASSWIDAAARLSIRRREASASCMVMFSLTSGNVGSRIKTDHTDATRRRTDHEETESVSKVASAVAAPKSSSDALTCPSDKFDEEYTLILKS